MTEPTDELVEQVRKAIASAMNKHGPIASNAVARAVIPIVEQAQAARIAELERSVRGWAEWYRRVDDGDDDCEYLVVS